MSWIKLYKDMSHAAPGCSLYMCIIFLNVRNKHTAITYARHARFFDRYPLKMFMRLVASVCIKFKSDKLVALGARCLWTRGSSLFPVAEPYAKMGGSDETNGESNVESDDAYEGKIKAKILAASLKYVNEFGWSQRAITAGAEAIGYPGVIHGMFPNAGAELVHHFQAVCNARLVEILQNEVRAVAEGQPRRTPPEKQLQNAVERRLRMVIPYKTNWPQALALVSLPPNLPNTLANLLGLVDDISYYTGDRSVDFNWYTRRAIIMAIYKSTELYMLQDDSDDHKRTWEFLERRIDETQQIHRVSSGVPHPARAADAIVNVAGAILHTASNMLGMNGGHR